MTKVRSPMTFEAAMLEIAAGLGSWDAVAAIARRSPSCVRSWSDPDIDGGMPLETAFALDAAFMGAGHDHAPLFLVYQRRLDVAARASGASTQRMLEAIGVFAREAGQAVEAGLRAAAPGATQADRIIAQREAEEASTALTDCLSQLGGRLSASGPEVPLPGAGPGTPDTG